MSLFEFKISDNPGFFKIVLQNRLTIFPSLDLNSARFEIQTLDTENVPALDKIRNGILDYEDIKSLYGINKFGQWLTLIILEHMGIVEIKTHPYVPEPMVSQAIITLYEGKTVFDLIKSYLEYEQFGFDKIRFEFKCTTEEMQSILKLFADKNLVIDKDQITVIPAIKKKKGFFKRLFG